MCQLFSNKQRFFHLLLYTNITGIDFLFNSTNLEKLPNFQIGIVESIVSEAVKTATESKDVFSSIAKAINKRFTNRHKKEDWNAIVRKNTIARDPIGSTRNSLTRSDRRSLRRRILEVADDGLKMDTQKLVEYNPKLSEATQTTRVAYVKFMAHAIRRESDVDAENEKKPVDMNKVRKSILRAASKNSMEEKKAAGTEKDDEKAENQKQSDDKKPENPSISDSSGQLIQLDDQVQPSNVIRAYSPIIEDPRERESRPSSSIGKPVEDNASKKRSDSISIPSRAMTPASITSRASSPLPETSSKDEVKEESKQESKQESNQTKGENSKGEAKEKPTVEAKPEPIFRPLITVKGKSKTTGKTIGGWI